MVFPLSVACNPSFLPWTARPCVIQPLWPSFYPFYRHTLHPGPSDLCCLSVSPGAPPLVTLPIEGSSPRYSTSSFLHFLCSSVLCANVTIAKSSSLTPVTPHPLALLYFSSYYLLVYIFLYMPPSPLEYLLQGGLFWLTQFNFSFCHYEMKVLTVREMSKLGTLSAKCS